MHPDAWLHASAKHQRCEEVSSKPSPGAAGLGTLPHALRKRSGLKARDLLTFVSPHGYTVFLGSLLHCLSSKLWYGVFRTCSQCAPLQHGKATLKWEFWCFYSKQCKKKNVSLWCLLVVSIAGPIWSWFHAWSPLRIGNTFYQHFKCYEMQCLVGKKKTNEKNMVLFRSLKEVIARKNSLYVRSRSD